MTATTERPTLISVLQQAQQLSPGDQARLATQLLSTLAPRLEQNSAPSANPWAVIAEIREYFRQQGAVSPSITEELIAMREERERSVHP